MSVSNPTRRKFLQSAAVATAALVCSAAPRSSCSQGPAAARRPVRLGAPVFDASSDPEQLALAHRKLGMRAAYCPAVELGDKQRIADIAAAFAKHDVVIAEVGRWKNLLVADPTERQQNLQFVSEGLALADEIGALCCVDIAGSFSRESWFGPHPQNLSREFFDAATETARKIIDAVKPKRAKFSFEMMGWALPDSADSYLQMIKAVERPAFAVHLDPCNLINSPARFYNTTDLLNDCFDKLGPWIVSCHAKDVSWTVEMQMRFQEVPIGAGALDYPTYLKRLASLPQDVPLMIEHMLDAAEYERSRQRVFAVGKELGLAFE
ncbi:MAG: sugar phosphate isomerase/epimerase family protein [Pirellulaceae bacterium]